VSVAAVGAAAAAVGVAGVAVGVAGATKVDGGGGVAGAGGGDSGAVDGSGSGSTADLWGASVVVQAGTDPAAVATAPAVALAAVKDDLLNLLHRRGALRRVAAADVADAFHLADDDVAPRPLLPAGSPTTCTRTEIGA
jgi:hypothetical protein